MKPNFDISLPSIPGKTIKFKIQDIKQTSFGSRKQRFQDNKKGLTKKFIDSFNNFHESKDHSRLEQQTQASQSNSRITVRSVGIPEQQKQKRFRHMIPEDKKHIISVYEKYREYQQPILAETKFDRGYTFQKAAKEVVKGKEEEREEQQNPKWMRKFVTDNYYFTQTILETQPNGQEQTAEMVMMTKKEEKTPKKRQRPSATFKNESRQRAIDRIYKSQVPGPGQYIALDEKQTKPHKIRSTSQKQSTTKPAQNDYKKLKNLITSIVGQAQEQQESQKQQPAKKQHLQHMFIKDDRDRFGQQKYPISSKVNVPGPGAYDIMHGIEEQARKVSLVEEQRKLLKEWFNN